MKRIIILTTSILLAFVMLAGCVATPSVTVTSLPSAPTTHVEQSVMPSADTSPTEVQTPSAMPSTSPTPAEEPSPSEEPLPTVEPTPSPTPSPTENIFKPSKHIPEINIEEGKSSQHYWFYEDDENIFRYKKLKGNDFNSLCSINKVTGKAVPVLDRCGSYFFEGEYIYWVEDDSTNKIYNMNRYNTQTKENITIYTSDKYLFSIEVYNNIIYFIEDRTSANHQALSYSDLYSVDINGGNIQKLIEDVGVYQLYENNIFYEPSGIDYYNFNSLFIYNIDSKDIKEVGRCKHVADFCVAYGNLCFCNKEDKAIVSIDLESGKKKIIEHNVDDTNGVWSLGQYIFYYNEDCELRAYDIINDKYYNISDEVYGWFGASNKNLYVQDQEEGGCTVFYMIKISGGKASIDEVKGLN